MDDSENYFLKIAAIGPNKEVGKILWEGGYSKHGKDDTDNTIGAEFFNVEIENEEEGYKAGVQVWVISPLDTFKTYRQRALDGMLGGLAFYDINDQSTFQNITPILEEIWRYSGRGVIPTLIVGYNEEHRDEESLKKETAEKYVSLLNEKTGDKGITVFHVNCETNTTGNLDNSFEILSTEIIRCLNNGII